MPSTINLGYLWTPDASPRATPFLEDVVARLLPPTATWELTYGLDPDREAQRVLRGAGREGCLTALAEAKGGHGPVLEAPLALPRLGIQPSVVAARYDYADATEVNLSFDEGHLLGSAPYIDVIDVLLSEGASSLLRVDATLGFLDREAGGHELPHTDVASLRPEDLRSFLFCFWRESAQWLAPALVEPPAGLYRLGAAIVRFRGDSLLYDYDGPLLPPGVEPLR